MAIKHGWAKTATYRCWNNMKKRCRRKTNKRYGGRGITYDPKWEQFENFLRDMGPKPDDKWLERKNNNGNYTKDNCIWETPRNQSYNRCNNNLVPGVCWINEPNRPQGGRWRASIRVGNKRLTLYQGVSYEKAVEARKQAEVNLELKNENVQR